MQMQMNKLYPDFIITHYSEPYVHMQWSDSAHSIQFTTGKSPALTALMNIK